jgi:hypothetical protein
LIDFNKILKKKDPLSMEAVLMLYIFVNGQIGGL